MSHQGQWAWLCLSLVKGLGPRRCKRLVEHCGGAVPAWKLLQDCPKQLAPLLPARLLQQLQCDSIERHAEQIYRLCHKHHWEILTLEDDRYPANLAQIDDPPVVLFLWGRLVPEDRWSVAVVGTRHATAYGKLHARRLAQKLAQAGLTIVSGLARGIDTQAHLGALDAQGRTLAVVAGGLDRIFPPENRSLAQQIAQHGAVLSEQPPGTVPRRELFPGRNRLISGLSLGVMVVEADEDSGALITTQHALEQGREVFALPGPVQNRTSRGPHRLIREGAKLVEEVQDILEELPCVLAQRTSSATLVPRAASDPSPRPAPTSPGESPPGLDPTQRKLWQLIADQGGPCPVDELIAQSGLSASEVLATLNLLELQGAVQRISGQMVQAAGYSSSRSSK